MRILALGFLLLPLLELAGSTALAAHVGWPGMIGWVLFTMVLGVVLLRAQGTMVLADLRLGLTRHASLGWLLRRRLLFTVAALLLIVPGVVSDLGAVILIGIATLSRSPDRTAPPPPPNTSTDSTNPRVLEGEFRELPRKPRS